MPNIDSVREVVQLLIDDFYRSMFSLQGLTDYAAVEMHQAEFLEKLNRYLWQFPVEDQPAVFALIDQMRGQASDECENNPVSFRQRLGTPRNMGIPANGYHPQGIGEVVVKAAVNATVWQTIAALFRSFR
jgi:hypothetical protein